MSQRWQNKNDVGFSIGGNGDNGVMLYVEASRTLGKWRASFHQTNDLTHVDGEYDSDRDATVAALDAVVRDLEETLNEARAELKRRKMEPSSPMRDALAHWGDAIQAFPIGKIGGGK